MSWRVVIQGGLFRVSQPGVDVFNPPSLDDDGLIFTSEWPNTERLHDIITVGPLNWGVNQQQTVYFVPLPEIPVIGVRYIHAETKIERDVVPWVYEQLGPIQQNGSRTSNYLKIGFFSVSVYADRLIVRSPAIIPGNIGWFEPVPYNYYAQIMVWRP